MKNKICFKCNIAKPLEEYYKHPTTGDGHLNKCKDCTKKDATVRFTERREFIREYDIKRQRYSIPRILKHRYKSMVQRSEGRAIHKTSALGLPVLSWEEFLEWHEANLMEFQELYQEWKNSDFTRKLAPSIDRIDNNLGYLADNMQWITQSQNSRKYMSSINNSKLTS